MAKHPQLPANKKLIFHFCGGPRGPHDLESQAADKTYGAALALWNMSRAGAVGCEFNCIEQDTVGRYRVVARAEEPDSITVTCEFVDKD